MRSIRTSFGIVCFLLFTIDIGFLRFAAGESNSVGLACEPMNNSHGTKGTAIEYVKLIESELGVPPRVDCGTNVEMPVYVNGVKSIGNPGLHQ
ncbi:MAG: hypothetical protein VB824_04700, partial [Dehalococcoidia bacterium]